MTRDQALSKIKKCLALGRSAEPHEAASAMRQAQKLMAEFNVGDHDISMLDVKEVRIQATSTAANLWELHLVSIVAEAFGCEHFGSITGEYNSAANYVRKRFYVFVGIDAAPTVAGYAYEVLSRQCAKSRLAHIKKQPKNCKPITKTARGDEFAKGWVAGVSDLVEKFANPAGDKDLLIGYIASKYPNMKTGAARDSTQGRKLDSGHRYAGYRAGKNAQLDRGISGREKQGLLAL